MAQGADKFPESKRGELEAILKQQVDNLKMIEEKEAFERMMEAKK